MTPSRAEAGAPGAGPNRPVFRAVFLGLLLATGMILAIFELYLPRPLPWAKPGLGNAVTLLALYFFGLREALLLSVVRVVLVNLWSGGFGGPTLLLAGAGALAATLAMAATLRLGHRRLSPVGISLVGAYAHVAAQLAMAGLVLVGRWQILYLLPLFAIPSFFAGIVVGIFSRLLLAALAKRLPLRFPLPGLAASRSGADSNL